MSRTSIMTIGILLILLGIKFNLVESYQLNAQATRFWMERIEDPAVAQQQAMQASRLPNYNAMPTYNPYQQASYPNAAMGEVQWPAKVISPPAWLCWPVFFVGAVMLLHGLSLKSST